MGFCHFYRTEGPIRLVSALKKVALSTGQLNKPVLRNNRMDSVTLTLK